MRPRAVGELGEADDPGTATHAHLGQWGRRYTVTTLSGERPRSPRDEPSATREHPVLALELLVHGVGGTTPQTMLDDPRVVCMAGDETAGVYRRPADDDAEDRPAAYHGKAVPEAYSWANLTSGNSSRALWLLLLPFMIVNLAHWMRPTARGPRPAFNRGYDLLVRLAALSLTVLLVAAACEVSMDLVAWQCAGTRGCASDQAWLGFLAADRGGWWSLPGRRLALAAVLPVAVVTVLWWLSHHTWSVYESQRPTGPDAPPAQHGPDPANRPALSLPGFWYGRRQVARLRAAHTAAGFLTVMTLLVTATLRHDRGAHQTWLTSLGWALVGLSAVLAVWIGVIVERGGRIEEREDELLDTFTIRWLPGFALAGTLLSALYASVGRDGWRSTGGIPGGGIFTGIAVAQCAVVVLLSLVARRMYRGHRQGSGSRIVLHGLGGPAVTMIACALGGLLTAGVAQRVADWLDRGTTPGAEDGLLPGPPVLLVWNAAAIPVVLLCLLLPLAVIARRYRRTHTTWVDAARHGHPGEREEPARTRQIARAGALAALTDQAPLIVVGLSMASFLLGGCAIAGSWITGEAPGQASQGAPRIIRGAAEVAQAAGSWLIGAAVVLMIALGRRAYRDAGARRTIGILWDVGTFWPRAAHPFAPPCYAERAVPDLNWRMATWVKADHRTLILSGHSQGTVLAAAAAWQLDPAARRKVALLTYGSPLERLYGRYFPAFFGPEALQALHQEVQLWKNLWRATDPIGGPVRVPTVDEGPLSDPASYGRSARHPLPSPILGHHDYQSDPRFAMVRAELLHGLSPQQAGAAAVPEQHQVTRAASEEEHSG